MIYYYRFYDRQGHIIARTDNSIMQKGALLWIKQGVASGAGEIVLNSIDTDGVKQGFDLEMLTAVCAIVNVPVIASGGAGKIDDFITLFKWLPKVDAGLAASIFHFGEVKISDLKQAMAAEGITARL